MDVTVTAEPDGETRMLTDLLGRDMGRVEKLGVNIFMIRTAGHAVETMVALTSKSYTSLDAALAAIEEHTRGVCRHAS